MSQSPTCQFELRNQEIKSSVLCYRRWRGCPNSCQSPRRSRASLARRWRSWRWPTPRCRGWSPPRRRRSPRSRAWSSVSRSRRPAQPRWDLAHALWEHAPVPSTVGTLKSVASNTKHLLFRKSKALLHCFEFKKKDLVWTFRYWSN